MNKQKRQGDLLLVRIAKLPEGLVKKQDGVIVYGEVTNHSHRLVDGDVYSDPKNEARLYLQTYVPTEIIHDDHAPTPIELPGLYEVRRKKEYKSQNMTALVVD